MKVFWYGWEAAYRAESLLTPTSLRSSTLSSASGKEGEEKEKLQLPSFRRRRREGRRAERCRGESTGARLLRFAQWMHLHYILCLLITFSVIIALPLFTIAQSPGTADSLIKIAVQLNKESKFTEAADKYSQALKIDPDNIYANYGIAYSLLQSDKGDEGIPYLEKVVKTTNVATAWAYDLLGSIYDKDNNITKAVEAFNAGIKADPKYQRLYYNLSLAYFRAKNYPDAEKSVVQSMKIDPTHANSQRVYALVCFHQNKRANALLGLCSFILLEPNTPRTKEAYGNIEHIIDGGTLKVGPGTGTPDIDANTAALNMAISKAIYEAGLKTYPTPADLLNAQLTGMFNALGPLADKQNSDELLRKYYVDFFYKLAQSPNMPAFAHLVSGSTPESAEWIKNNAQKMGDLDSWVKGTVRTP